jgi:rSAM/selenodomain-associated transferase 1
MSKNLIIVFAKNNILGTVKTRLAATIGDQMALEVYNELLRITENSTKEIPNTEVHIYFSNSINLEIWPKSKKFLQKGADLGERMQQAFTASFDQGYQKVIGIGSDLPDISKEIIVEAFKRLTQNDAVFGPSMDGGYYLLGMTQMIPEIFENKPWSTEELLNLTLNELQQKKTSTSLLQTLNDIDTISDFEKSTLYQKFASKLNPN